jgi:hypothetical protein
MERLAYYLNSRESEIISLTASASLFIFCCVCIIAQPAGVVMSDKEGLNHTSCCLLESCYFKINRISLTDSLYD